MRTTGRVVIHRRSRKCLARIGLPEVVLRRGGCCTLVLHVSVVRDQVVIVKPVIGLNPGNRAGEIVWPALATRAHAARPAPRHSRAPGVPPR